MRSAAEKRMLALFVDEAEETLVDIEKRCLLIDGENYSKELQIIFRAAHNVKGAARLYGLNDLGGMVHIFEDLLSILQKNQKPVSPQSVDVLLSAQSFLKSWLNGIRENDTFLPDCGEYQSLLIKHMDDLKAELTAPAVPEPAAEQDNDGALARQEAQSPLEANLEPAASEPSEESKTPEPIEAPAQSAPAPAIASNGPASAAPVVKANIGGGDSGQNGDNRRNGDRRRQRAANTLRISSDKLDEIIQMIGELSIQQGILWHNYQSNTLNALTCKNSVILNQKTIKNLYHLVLTLRMQTAETLLQRMERTARDIARNQGKTINIQMSGADTPVDKTVIEMIADPLMHIVRNAVDHGIEPDEVRKSMGKPVPSRLAIEIQQESGNVVVTISDDGRGLDPQLILDNAIKKGLVAPGEKLKEDDIIQLIFLPGFSTRDKVTEISGRGVGMDIVQKALLQLGGRIDIRSKKGHGTTFEINLPASLEIIDGLAIRVTNQTYIVPRQDIEEIIDLDSVEIERIARGSSAIRMRKTVIPVESLSDYIGISHERNTPEPGSQASGSAQKDIALLIRLQDRSKLALRIDGIIGQQQIVVRPLSDHLAKAPAVNGVTILGNGQPAMILNLTDIGNAYLHWINSFNRQARERA